jgi:hypothetical protein
VNPKNDSPRPFAVLRTMIYLSIKIQWMSSTSFHNFLFCPFFAVLMLLWQLVDLDCSGVMLAGPWRCSAGLIRWGVFQCGAPHNYALSSCCLSTFVVWVCDVG